MPAQGASKPYGIIVRMPEGDPMAASHLLGESWRSEHWFDTAAARDRAYSHMLATPGNYRQGDKPSVVLAKVDPD